MEPITHIYVYGDIVNFQSNEAEYWGCVSLTTIKQAVDANPDATEIKVHIHSCGGDMFEAFAIYDYLMSLGKTITTIVEGICASSATVILLAGSVRQLTTNSEFLIHNPMTWADGNADEIEAAAAALREQQERLLNFYVEKTGADAAVLQALMDEDKFITPDEAVTMGFATEVLDTLTALASVRNKVNQKLIYNSIKRNMKTDQKTKLKGFVAKVEDLLRKLKNEAVEPEAATSNSVKLDDGTLMYFAEDAITEGIAVFEDEAMTTPFKDGDYTGDDGDTYVIKGGKVDSITDADNTGAETDAQAVARLTTELAEANARADEAETLATTLGTSLEAVTAQLDVVVSSGWKPKERTTVTTTTAQAPRKPAPAKTESLKDGVKALKEERKAAMTKK